MAVPVSRLISLVDEVSGLQSPFSLSEDGEAQGPRDPFSVCADGGGQGPCDSFSVQMVRARVPVIPGLTMLFCCVPGGHLVPRPHACTDMPRHYWCHGPEGCVPLPGGS